MIEDKLYAEIKTMLAEIAEIDEAQIAGDAKFMADLGLDSMLALEIVAALEKKYKIIIPETKFPDLSTLNKSVEIVRELLPKA